jgi:hypothetical protein
MGSFLKHQGRKEMVVIEQCHFFQEPQQSFKGRKYESHFIEEKTEGQTSGDYLRPKFIYLLID